MSKWSTLTHKFNWTHPTTWGFKVETSLDFGCGTRPRNPFHAQALIGVDIVEGAIGDTGSNIFANGGSEFEFRRYTLKRHSLLPFPDQSFDAVTMFDVMEHLSREPRNNSNELILTLNEIVRVLKVGGVFFAVTPCFPSPAAFQDPTHVNIITEFTSHYFSGDNPPAELMGYGFTGGLSLFEQFWVGPQNSFMDKTLGSSQKQMQATLKTLRNPSKWRGLISSLRNPTHLTWVMIRIS